MKIMFLSDTHGRHNEITELYGELPYVDIIVHSGDCTRYGEFEETDLFMNWFSNRNAMHKVLVAGNHDFVLQQTDRRNWLLANNYGVTYLEDSFINIDGLGIYGSPWSPVFGMWAFMKHRNAELDEVWQKVPTDGSVDLLVTHSPRYGRFDVSVRGNYNVGCEMLANRINDIHPKVHVFGHIHECGGMIKEETEVPLEGMISLNASLLNIRYVLANPIWIWDTETNDWSSIEIKE
jgi:Icc-related predicted phosphoesterase